MRAQDFLAHDACHVCGQTPCNCTHISEAKTMIVPDNNVASAKKLYQYLVRNLIDIASMISFYEENYNKPYYEKKFDGFFKDSAGNPVKVIFDDGAKVEYESGILYIPAATYYRYRGFLTGQRFIPDVLNALGTPMEQSVAEDLRKWFKEKWVRFGPDGKIRGDCARGDDSEGKPKCLPQSKAHALGKKGRASAAARKRRQDPNPERKGAAINVATKKKSNEALIREVQNKMFHEVLADRLPAGIVDDADIVRSAWEIAAQKMGPVRATRLFREVPGFDHDLITAYRAKHPVNEARDQTLSDAQTIAAQIRDFMDEYYNLQRSGRKDADTLAAINMSKRSVAALNQELQQLGYKYAPTVAGLVALKGTPFVEEGVEQCPECGGPAFSDLLLAEKKDACYHKVRSRYKVWPSAYASGALVQCRKKGAANWGNKSKNEGVAEDTRVELGNVTAKKLQVGDTVSYFGEKARVVELNPAKNYARISANGKTMNVRLSDLKRTGQGMAETDNFRAPAAMMKASPQALSQAQNIVQQQADKNVIGQAKIAGAVPNQGVAEEQLDEKCWDTHRQEGMKRKGDRMVPNCVPKESTAPKSAIGAAIAQVRR